MIGGCVLTYSSILLSLEIISTDVYSASRGTVARNTGGHAANILSLGNNHNSTGIWTVCDSRINFSMAS